MFKLKEFTMGYQHPFKDKLMHMCTFSGAQPTFTFWSDPADELRDHRLYVYCRSIRSLVIIDNSNQPNPQLAELFDVCTMDGATIFHGTLGAVASLMSFMQQYGTVLAALDWTQAHEQKLTA